jgi:nucleoid DNA-binding protein
MALVGKDQLVHEIAERSGLGIEESRHALEEMLNSIETQLGKGNEVRLTGFGKFSVSRRKAREGRNPQTGEPLKIAAKKVPHFSAGAELKNAVPDAPQEGASRSNSKRAGGGTRKGASAGGPKRASAGGPKRRRAAKPDSERSQGGRRRPKPARKPTTRKRDAPDDEAARDSGGADEAESAGSGKAASVATSAAKIAVVAAAGIAAGVAGGLAIVNRR